MLENKISLNNQNNQKLRIYINTSKAYYYPGEKIEASILLDVFDKVKCDKMMVISKGKTIIRATQNSSSFDEDDYDNNTIKPEQIPKNKKKKKSIVTVIDDTSSEDIFHEAMAEKRQIDESKEIFKYKKIIKISSNGYLNKGRYTFPFELESPENIPGSFLYIDKKVYAEIYYSLKVKLNKIMLKEVVPIVIRQRESIFNYERTTQFEKSILGCCCDNNKAIIKASTESKYYLSNDEVRLNINIDNKNNDIFGSPLNVELYQRIILFPKDKFKKIKITNIVGEHQGKKTIRSHKNYHKNISFHIKKLECSYDKLNESKAIKHYKHKDVISFLNSSINSDLIICEYEAYAGVQFPNWNDQELGVFISVLIYPPIEGILSKTVQNLEKEFNNSIINKKIFLSKKNNNKEDLKEDKYDEAEFKNKSFFKYDDGSAEKFKKKYMLMEKEKEYEKKKKINNEKNEDEINDIDNIDENSQNNKNKINDYNYTDKNKINMNNNKEKYNFEQNKNYSNNKISDIDTINTLQIKKNFNGDFLKDPLDNEFLDKESFQ